MKTQSGLLLVLLLVLGCAPSRHPQGLAVTFAPGGADDSPHWPDDSIVAVDVLGTASTRSAMLGALWLPVGAALALAALLATRHLRRARREAASAVEAPRVDGLAVIQGVVENDGEDSIVVTVSQERLTYKDKAGVQHIEWREKHRSVIARPFHVRLDAGRRVRVEPDDKVLLRDALEAPEPVHEYRRLRRVRLRTGERVWVAGRLSGVGAERAAGAYRAGNPTAVMRPGLLERMVVSTEAPGDYDRTRARYHLGWVKALGVILVLTHCVLLFNTTAQMVSGREVTLDIERVAHWSVWAKPKNRPGYWVRHCGVSGRAGPGAALEEHEVRCIFHDCVARGACRTLPTTRALVTGNLLREVGRGPVAHTVQLIFAGIIGWVASLVYCIAAATSRPWYAGGKVHDRA